MIFRLIATLLFLACITYAPGILATTILPPPVLNTDSTSRPVLVANLYHDTSSNDSVVFNDISKRLTETTVRHNDMGVTWDADFIKLNGRSPHQIITPSKTAVDPTRVPIPPSALLLFSGIILYLGIKNRYRVQKTIIDVYRRIIPRSSLQYPHA
jgi:hypothetical protein